VDAEVDFSAYLQSSAVPLVFLRFGQTKDKDFECILRLLVLQSVITFDFILSFHTL
jgi:hypothetical protein